MTTNRLESFSDGVLAIAITLLAIELVVPSVSPPDSLATALARQWPEDVAYVISFVVIGIVWIEHHRIAVLADAVDGVMLIANLALLLAVVTIPFSTHLLASYLGSGGEEAEVAASVYSSVMLAVALAFTGLHHAIRRRQRLAGAPIAPAVLRGHALRFHLAQAAYLLLAGLSFWSPRGVLIGQGAVAVAALADQARIGNDPGPSRPGGRAVSASGDDA